MFGSSRESNAITDTVHRVGVGILVPHWLSLASFDAKFFKL